MWFSGYDSDQELINCIDGIWYWEYGWVIRSILLNWKRQIFLTVIPFIGNSLSSVFVYVQTNIFIFCALWLVNEYMYTYRLRICENRFDGKKIGVHFSANYSEFIEK